MKKITSIMTALLCCALFTTSCHTDDEIGQTDNYPRDTSLAGSVYMNSYKVIKAEGTFDGKVLDNLESDISIFDVTKDSDTDIALQCLTEWGNQVFEVNIRCIPLSGIAYDVTFDHTSGAGVIYNGHRYTPYTTVKGWIKKVDTKSDKSLNGYITKDIAIFSYDCDIEISCTLDDKPLRLKITSINYF